jgi:hypothetical protein
VKDDHPNSGDVVIWDVDRDQPATTYWVKRQGRGAAAQLFEGPDAWERAQSAARQLAGPDGILWTRHPDGRYELLDSRSR